MVSTKRRLLGRWQTDKDAPTVGGSRMVGCAFDWCCAWEPMGMSYTMSHSMSVSKTPALHAVEAVLSSTLLWELCVTYTAAGAGLID